MQIEIYNMIPVGENIFISLEAVCDSFSSLLWNIEYYKCGAFEVYIAASPRNIEIFQTGSARQCFVASDAIGILILCKKIPQINLL